ncbi:MAG: YeeE/YedE family protein [Alphaproteobacteria bacterium]|nr:YeeE/YedE family protein [Alphaproteobacteria bacterium]
MRTSFTPAAAAAGGLFIGASVWVLFVGIGRIPGISGIVRGLLRRGEGAGDRAWRGAFLVGLILGPVLASAAAGRPLIRPDPASTPVLAAAGLLVGVGTGLANGCTSGHGVCGVSRLSPRSLAATALFMACGFLTASVLRRLL